ncbi:hypothetical protein D9758_002785 [Tetrapyrgos nigripes]|uniref:Nickel/cobalt efflux system n=1 Tax=Tetrapyrgos nigripes TaxID=182062 RepID=A0A8H5GR57_9AGAR|nr:hypothetical protein D9758_002785 [Tetrapyrgos nigripes]
MTEASHPLSSFRVTSLTRIMPKLPRLTLFGRSLLLVSAELIANAVCWAVTGILFSRFSNTTSVDDGSGSGESGGDEQAKSILGLAMLAWTLGLRHVLSGLARLALKLILSSLPNTIYVSFLFISAIDNATRGHSTIVIVVNVAIAISTDIANRLDGVSSVGGIIGASISGSFLFIIAAMNSIFLWKILKRRRDMKKRALLGESAGQNQEYEGYDPKKDKMFLMRIIGPVITFVDRPWKMYPVGILFGFGFDTASSIALLAVSALAKKNADGSSISSGSVVILPFLFTAGMTLVDSLDAVLVLYSYSGFPERGWRIFERREREQLGTNEAAADVVEEQTDPCQAGQAEAANENRNSGKDVPENRERIMTVKRNMMSSLSVILTLMSILLAFSISLITIMALIGENCDACQRAADAEDGGGLAGSWWRAWARASDSSGYIGAAIVAVFVVVVAAWYGVRWAVGKYRKQNSSNSGS